MKVFYGRLITYQVNAGNILPLLIGVYCPRVEGLVTMIPYNSRGGLC
jgi:hypothetical protein